MNATFLKEAPAGTFLALKVQPRASRNAILGAHGTELKVAVTAPPVDSAANRALLEFLAVKLDLPRSALALVRGDAARHKLVLVKGLAPAQILQKLGLIETG